MILSLFFLIFSFQRTNNIISLGVSTVETHQDLDWAFLTCWDKLLKTVKIFLCMSQSRFLNFKFFLVRLCHGKIFVESVKTFWVWKWWKVSTDWEVSLMLKSIFFFVKIETNFLDWPKFAGPDKFLDLDLNFRVWTLMSRQNQEELFENIKIFLIVETDFLTMLRSRILIDTTSRQIETLRLRK